MTPELPPPPADAVLLPAPGRRDFAETWVGLPELSQLHIPWGLRSQVGDQTPSEAQLFDHIDTGGSVYDDGQQRLRVGLVATDARLLVPDVILGVLPTAVALRRFFFAEQLQGVAWNSCDEYSAYRTTGHIAVRSAVPRLAGMSESPDPLARREPHARLAERLLDEDRVFAAFHHATLAREGGADLESSFLTELDALRLLSLRKEAASFQQWYGSQGGRKPRRVALYAAGAQIETGQPEAALRACAPFLDDPELAARAWLEQGRALVALRRPGEAVAAFDRSLALRPGACETLLGKGIALRTLHWEPANPEGLRAAAVCFEEVRERGDFSVPEATHHLATIHLAFGEWARVEELSREAHRLRQSPVSRRNLCLALHAQGRIEEAFQEYQFLAQHDPVQAAPLQKYFAR